MSHQLENFFNPRSIAVIGATQKEGKVGRVILETLAKKFNGKIYPVNPGYDEILGLKCYKNVNELPEPPDLAVIAIPAPGVPGVLKELGWKGCKVAIIISGGFAETGTPEGRRLEEEVKRVGMENGIRIIGPNCIGICDNWSGVDTFFLPEEKMKRPPRGHVAFISQSGAYAAALMDWMANNGIGISRAISYGNKVDVDDVDLLEYLAGDDKTKVILLYIEGLKDGRGRAFLETAKKVCRIKPVLAFKAGKTGRGSMAAASHTAALAGDYSIYRAAFKQAGIIEVESFDEIMDAVRILLDQPLMRGNRVYVVTDGGGVGVMLTDALTIEGFEMPRTPLDLKEVLRSILPSHCIVENPIDLTGDTDDERYARVLDKIIPRDDVDAVIVVVLPQVPRVRGSVVEYLIEAKRKYGKPIVAVVIGGEEAIKMARRLQENGITVFESPERAARALKVLYTYSTVKLKGVQLT